MRLILGSQSPNRSMVLEQMGYAFEIMVPNIDEKQIRREDPKELVLAVAHAKADEVVKRVSGEAVVIASDTVSIVNGAIREKPRTTEEAYAFLADICASVPEHVVSSVVVVNTKTGKRLHGVGEATAIFSRIPENIVREFVESGEVFRFAGGFAIELPQFKPYIKEVVGEWETIVGLPKKLTQELLRGIGYAY